MFDVVSDYRYIFVSRNYVFYRIEDKYIRIINLYHEKEDFMWQLFGIDTTPQETHGHLEIESCGKLGLCSVEYKENVAERIDEITDFCNKILEV